MFSQCCKPVTGAAERHHPYFLSRPRVGPSSRTPLKIEGDGAPSGATIVLSCRVPSRERGRLSARHRGVLPSGGRARFAGVLRLVDDRRQPAPGGQPLVAAGRSPGAARVRALRGTSAGAASCSTIKTPLDDALDEQDKIGLSSSRNKVKGGVDASSLMFSLHAQTKTPPVAGGVLRD